MRKAWQHGDWLLVDAAGPAMITGIVRNGDWLHQESHRDGFLESLQPGVQAQLDATRLALPELAGVLYAAGPGSTLGLRLAAMFVRALMQLPALAHWKCLCYNNLELACADQIDPAAPAECRLFAPWRRDRVHEVRFTPGPPPRFSLATADPGEVDPPVPSIVELGHRAANLPEEFTPVPYPADRIPAVLGRWPQLLEPAGQPVLYSAQAPSFAKWSSRRHTAS